VTGCSLAQIYGRFRDRPDVREVSTKRGVNANRLKGVAPPGHRAMHATTRVGLSDEVLLEREKLGYGYAHCIWRA